MAKRRSASLFPQPPETRLLVALIQTRELTLYRQVLKKSRYRHYDVINGETGGGNWPLLAAVRSGRIAYVRATFQAGANINKQSFSGHRYTALQCAIDYKHKCIERYLRQNGAVD